MNKKFPVLWTIILVFSIIWLIQELGYFYIDLPWFPVILIITAIGGIFNRLG